MTQQHAVLGGRYQLDQVIGRGGMAEVWRARDLRLGRDVAVKRLRVDLATDPTFQARFRREAQSAAGLNHPNIVATYDTGEENDERTGIAVPWIVMELVEGHTLRDLLRTDRRILPEKALEWTQGVLDALNYSHRAGIIHRDIKPANVMLTPTGQVKVMDFGIARAVADTSATMTQTAAVIGTAQYLSPEQARGETVDSRSDVYSAGCLLYELLVGRPPFTGDSPVSVAYQHVREQPVPPSQLDPELTSSMDAVVLKSLAKDPTQRYQTAKQMRDDIARVLAGEPVIAPPALLPPQLEETALTEVVGSPPDPVPLFDDATASALPIATADAAPTRKRPVTAWILGLLLLALIAAIGVLGWQFLSPQRNTVPMVQVPGVVGFNEAGATSNLQGAGFKVTARHENGAADTKDEVTKQVPGGGSQASKGSTVVITVNDGPVTNKVPSGLVGMTEQQARRALEKAGFKDANISTETADANTELLNPALKKGQVAATNPASGADVVPATQKVVLQLATGRSTVPNVNGLSEQEARQALNKAGFSNVDTQPGTAVDAADDGKVIEQSHKPDSSLSRQETVTITIGRYEAPAPSETATAQPSDTGSPQDPGSSSSPSGEPSATASTPGDTASSPDPSAPASEPTPGSTPS